MESIRKAHNMIISSVVRERENNRRNEEDGIIGIEEKGGNVKDGMR